MYQEEGVGEAADLLGIEVEDRRNEGFGYGVYGQRKYMGSESLAWRGKERSVPEIVEIVEDRFRD